VNIGKSDLERFYDWRQTQAAGLGTGSFKLAGLILSPLLAAVFDSAARIEEWAVYGYSFGALLAAVAGIRWHREARRLQLEYKERVKLLPSETKPRNIVTW
jgi:hypothetical protein